MKRRLSIAAAIAATALFQVAASPGRATAKDDDRVSFKHDVAPVLGTSCATKSCHGGGGRMPVLQRTMDASKLRASLVGIASEQRPDHVFVKPGAPDSSYLVQKIEGHLVDAECIDHDCGAPMPLDNPSLSPEARRKIKTWIAQGAPDN